MLQIAQGGTGRLYGEYKDSAGALVDPTTPLVDILNPSGGVVVNDAVPVRDSLGQYHYDFTAALSAPLGDDWTARWTGVIAGGTVTGDELFEVVPVGTVTTGDSTRLVSLEKLKRALGVEGSDHDQRLLEAIEDASSAVADYAGRGFGTDPVTEDRTFFYDGKGFLNIDDASVVNSVRYYGTSATFPDESWVARAELPPNVFTYLELPIQRTDPTGMMGFERNLDTFLERYGTGGESRVIVNATWGWTVVPGAVQRAAMFTAAAMLAFPPTAGVEGGQLASESIADMARSYVINEGLETMRDGIPTRAQGLLEPYRRHSF